LLDADARPFIQAATTAGAGVVRSADSLQATMARLTDIATERTTTEGSPGAWETTGLHTVATVITRHARLREETRGGHWRRDHPTRDDDHWRGHLVSTVDADGTLRTRYQPVEETFQT